MRPTLIPLSLCLLACGGGGNSFAPGVSNPFQGLERIVQATTEGRCESTNDSYPGPFRCRDIRGSNAKSVTAFEQECEGRFTANAICDLTHSLGGCMRVSVDGSKTTTWYFPESHIQTAAQVENDCDSWQMFIKPP